MKICCITIEPLSYFGTPIKGDTLFGHFCWQAAYDATLLTTPFETAIKSYGETPFAIFSTAVPILKNGGFALKRPDAPLDKLFALAGLKREEAIDQRKMLKSKKWMLCDRPGALENLATCRYGNDQDLLAATGLTGSEFTTETLQSHNSINRLTGSTGEGFAPYAQPSISYPPGIRLALLIGYNPEMITVEGLLAGVTKIGLSGFGRDASTGMGRFKVVTHSACDLAAYGAKNPNALYTLAPSVPEAGCYRDMLFTPFTRFGKHGDRLAISGKPFKNPVIMADEGALLLPHDLPQALQRPYVGTALTGLSKIQESTIAQGYALTIPVRLEV